MHLAIYRFDGDTDDLEARYEKLVASFPPGVILLNICVRRPDGITVVDACPTKADFQAFSTSAEFAEGLAAVGLPTPTIDLDGAAPHVVGTLISA